MLANQRQVVPHGDGWAVKAPRATRASSVHRIKDDAIDAARVILANDGGGEMLIHRRDGSFQRKHTIAPGNDPFPPRG